MEVENEEEEEDEDEEEEEDDKEGQIVQIDKDDLDFDDMIASGHI